MLGRCGVKAGDACAVLAETQSRPLLVELASLALQQLGARSFVVTVPSPAASAVPVRSTGASTALGGHDAAVQSLSRCALVVDCTVEGLQHAAELPAILAGGARVLVVSNEHPEILERCLPRAEDEAVVREAMRRLKSAKRMTVFSRAGTDLQIELAGARVGGVWGFTSKPGTLTHWPGGLALAFPAAGCVNGTLVLDRGDVNLTFKRYLADAVRLHDRRRPCDRRHRRFAGCRADARLLRRLGRPRGLCRVACRLGIESTRALGRDGVLRQERFQRHRAARLRRQLPLLDRRQ